MNARLPRRHLHRPIVATLAGIYGLGALVHLYFLVVDPGVYEQFGVLALLDAYGTLWDGFVVPNLRMLLPLVVLLEAGVALSIIRRGRTASRGHYAGMVFQLGLVPSGPWGPINAVLAWGHWRLAKRERALGTGLESQRAEPEAEDTVPGE